MTPEQELGRESEDVTLPYNPALDGIRAIAIAAVMVYHGFLGWGHGGFLGVDLFFVLSGYLITALLLHQHDQEGAVDLARFWRRRLVRLMPALLVMLSFVAIYGAFIAESADVETLRRDGISTLFSVANWSFIASDLPLSDQLRAPLPLRHMWSLSVEVQWYLVWPVLFVLGTRAAGVGRRIWPMALLTAATGSAVLMAVLANGESDLARPYYGTDTRGLGLLVGAALAFLLARGPSWVTSTLQRAHVAAGLGGAGLAGFLLLILTVKDTQTWPYRGGFVLVALCGAALIIGAVASPPDLAFRRSLGDERVALVGRISYGLYLWHWPLFVLLSPDRTGSTGAGLFIIRVVATAAVASASYYLLERPARHWTLAWPKLAAGVAGIAGAVGIGLALASAGVAGPTETGTGAPSELAIEPTRVFVIGDVVELLVEVEPSEVPTLDLRSGAFLGCGILPPKPPVTERCLKRFDIWESTLENYDPDIALVAMSVWDLVDQRPGTGRIEFGTPEFEAFATEQMDIVVNAVDQGGTTEVKLLNLACRRPDVSRGRLLGLSHNDIAERTVWLNDFLDQYAASVDEHDVTVADSASYLCPTGEYTNDFDGTQLYSDGVHFTPQSAPIFWNWLLPQLSASPVPPLIPPEVSPILPAPTPAPTPVPEPTPVPPTSVYLMGDSVWAELVFSASEADLDPSFELASGAILNCGLLAPAPGQASGGCDERYDQWATQTEDFAPRFVIAGLSIWDTLDLDVGGQSVAFGSEAFRGIAFSELDRLIDTVGSPNTEVILVTLPCTAPQTPPHSQLSPDQRAQRRTFLNTILRDYVAFAENPSLRVLELGEFTCPTGAYQPQLDDVELHRDGVHYTPEGALLVWERLLDTLRSAR